jgi:hypothetical protein
MNNMKIYSWDYETRDGKNGYLFQPTESRGNGWMKCRMCAIIKNGKYEYYDPEIHKEDSYMTQTYSGRLRRNGTLDIFFNRRMHSCKIPTIEVKSIIPTTN